MEDLDLNIQNYDLEDNISSEVIKLGYSKKNNFLSQEEFLEVKREYNQAINEIKTKIKKEADNDKQLSDINHHIKLKIDENTKEKYPAIYRLKNNFPSRSM